MFRPNTRSAMFLDAHLPPPPSVVKKWTDEDKKKVKKQAKVHGKPTQRNTIAKTVPAKVVRSQLKWLLENQIPSLNTALQSAKYQREKDARILNRTIGDLLSTLTVKQKALKMKEAEIKSLKEKAIVEIAALRNELENKNALLDSLTRKLESQQQISATVTTTIQRNEIEEM